MAMDVTSLYTNILQEEGINIICKAYERFYKHYLKEFLSLILNESSFQFNGENFLQKSGIAMGAKMAVSFANIFMTEIKTKIIQQSDTYNLGQNKVKQLSPIPPKAMMKARRSKNAPFWHH